MYNDAADLRGIYWDLQGHSVRHTLKATGEEVLLSRVRIWRISPEVFGVVVKTNSWSGLKKRQSCRTWKLNQIFHMSLLRTLISLDNIVGGKRLDQRSKRKEYHAQRFSKCWDRLTGQISRDLLYAKQGNGSKESQPHLLTKRQNIGTREKYLVPKW